MDKDGKEAKGKSTRKREDLAALGAHHMSNYKGTQKLFTSNLKKSLYVILVTFDTKNKDFKDKSINLELSCANFPVSLESNKKRKSKLIRDSQRFTCPSKDLEQGYSSSRKAKTKIQID